MCSPLVVFVADPYRTESSCAVLGYLQQSERRRSGRRVQFVFDPTSASAPGLLGGADGAVLVLLEGQRAAAEKLLRFWETLNRDKDWPIPVLPVLIRDGRHRENGWQVSSLVTVAESDILVEHGGYPSLSESAETNIEQALNTVLHSAGARLYPTNARCCPFA